MAHLKKLPTYFVKDGVRRAAYYTIQAREFRAAGFVEEGAPAEAAPVAPKVPEQPVVAGGDGFEDLMADQLKTELDSMTKAELLEWAEDLGYDLKNALPKAEILAMCKHIENGTRDEQQ
jgi:hypothetical protein